MSKRGRRTDAEPDAEVVQRRPVVQHRRDLQVHRHDNDREQDAANLRNSTVIIGMIQVVGVRQQIVCLANPAAKRAESVGLRQAALCRQNALWEASAMRKHNKPS